MAFRRCITYFLDLSFTSQMLAIDRYVQIRPIMSMEFSSTNQQFDVWHLSNNFKKNWYRKRKAKTVRNLGCRLRQSATTCGGVPATAMATKTGCKIVGPVIHHVVNQHTFTGKQITQCPH